MNQKGLEATNWTIAVTVVTLAITAWLPRADNGFSLYVIFPLLGILAFSLMWTHYISGALKRYFEVEETSAYHYFKVTSWIVLFLILLHPGIFTLQLWLDGLGLPPSSYYTVYPDLASRIAITIGTISLLAFLTFELRRKFQAKSWWKYIEYLNVAAMFGIFYHGLTLGGELMTGWFLALWWIYGTSLAVAIAYTYIYDYRKERNV